MKLHCIALFSLLLFCTLHAADEIDASSLRGRVLCGYQGWFRCPGDAMNAGWIHWSRDGKRITPETLTFEMWPDLSGFPENERFNAPGFTYPDGRQAQLFSSDNAATVKRHFEWMREYGIDGVWLQHFIVDFPEGPARSRYSSRLRVLEHVRNAAKETGRVWALTYDISGMAAEKIFDSLTRDWKKQVDAGVTSDPRYIHEGGKPAVQLFGFYRQTGGSKMTPEIANRLIDFSKRPARIVLFSPVPEIGTGARIPIRNGRRSTAGSTHIRRGTPVTHQKIPPASSMPRQTIGRTIKQTATSAERSGFR